MAKGALKIGQIRLIRVNYYLSISNFRRLKAKNDVFQNNNFYVYGERLYDRFFYR